MANKKPRKWTAEEMVEWQRCQADPVYFITKYVRIQHPVMGAIPFDLFDGQKSLIQTYQEFIRVCALIPRQSGKDSATAAYVLWQSIFKHDQNILVLSHSRDAAREFMSRVWYAFENLPEFLRPDVRRNQAETKQFDNGSKIMCRSAAASSGCGMAISLLVLIEFAYVRPRVATEMWTSVYPTIATGGRCIVVSSANDEDDQFVKIWLASKPGPLGDRWVDQHGPRETPEEGGIDFVGFHMDWRSIPEQFKKNPDGSIVPVAYRGEQFKERLLRSGFDADMFAREYECQFRPKR